MEVYSCVFCSEEYTRRTDGIWSKHSAVGVSILECVLGRFHQGIQCRVGQEVGKQSQGGRRMMIIINETTLNTGDWLRDWIPSAVISKKGNDRR